MYAPHFNEQLTHIHPARVLPFGDLLDGLTRCVGAGHVSARYDGPRALYCYTNQCVYEGAWNEFTTLARGLILDLHTHKVVATPFPKFFNIGERKESVPDLPFEAFDKLDGSMITIYFHNGEWRTATKGSFDSAQARWAKRELHKVSMRDECGLLHLHPGATYLCEAIYRDNKIVVRYPYESLVLLAAYNEDGRELAHRNLAAIAGDMGWRVAERFEYPSMSHLLAESKTWKSDVEGRVLRFSNGERIKIKGEDYCHVHRLVSGCTPLALWEAMLKDASLPAMRLELPEEFWPDFDAITAILTAGLAQFVGKVTAAVASVAHLSDRELGPTLATRVPAPYGKYVFHLRKKGELLPPPNWDNTLNPIPMIRRAVFNEIRPAGNKLTGYTPSASVHRVHEELTP
jgi:RNA ligase